MAGKKVLVVEDSAIIRLEVKRILQKYGVEVLELDNAEDLLRFPGRFQGLNLLILDVTLPGMDGLTALERMRASKEWAYLPIIMLTARADLNTVQRALQAGAVNYIRKPFTQEGFLERVEQVLGPLVQPEPTSLPPPEAALDGQLRQELNRARRSSTQVSLMQIMVPDDLQRLSRLPDLMALRDRLKAKLREIDSVFLTPERNLLLILPMTTVEGLTVVTAKVLNEWGDETPTYATVTFPEDGASEVDLMKALQSKLAAASLQKTAGHPPTKKT